MLMAPVEAQRRFATRCRNRAYRRYSAAPGDPHPAVVTSSYRCRARPHWLATRDNGAHRAGRRPSRNFVEALPGRPSRIDMSPGQHATDERPQNRDHDRRVRGPGVDTCTRALSCRL